MKKTLIIMGILALPIVGFAAKAIIRINASDYMADVQTVNNGNVYVYKLIDGNNVCYITAGSQNSISCIQPK